MFGVEITLEDAERHARWTKGNSGTVVLEAIDTDGNPNGKLAMLAHSNALHGLSQDGFLRLCLLLEETQATIYVLTCYPALVRALQRDLMSHPRVHLVGDWSGSTNSFHIKSRGTALLFAKENK